MCSRIFSYLSSLLSCSKDTLIKRAMKLRLLQLVSNVFFTTLLTKAEKHRLGYSRLHCVLRSISIHSFIHSHVLPFIYSVAHLFANYFTCSFIPLFADLLFHSFTHLLVGMFTAFIISFSFIQSLIYFLMHSFLHTFAHSQDRLWIHRHHDKATKFI